MVSWPYSKYYLIANRQKNIFKHFLNSSINQEKFFRHDSTSRGVNIPAHPITLESMKFLQFNLIIILTRAKCHHLGHLPVLTLYIVLFIITFSHKTLKWPKNLTASYIYIMICVLLREVIDTSRYVCMVKRTRRAKNVYFRA